MPVAAAGYPVEDRIATADSQLQQIGDPIADRLPLLPVTASDASAYPNVEIATESVSFGDAEVTNPPAHILRKLIQSVFHGYVIRIQNRFEQVGYRVRAVRYAPGLVAFGSERFEPS